jgi:hypothetical protein
MRFIAAALIFGLSVHPRILCVVVVAPTRLSGGANEGGNGGPPAGPFVCSGRKMFFTEKWTNQHCAVKIISQPKFS